MVLVFRHVLIDSDLQSPPPSPLLTNKPDPRVSCLGHVEALPCRATPALWRDELLPEFGQTRLQHTEVVGCGLVALGARHLRV